MGDTTAVCSYCNREMLTANGCLPHRIASGNQPYFSKAGEEEHIHQGWINPGEQCHDCGAKYGYFHHPGCDTEECPICGGQAFVCDHAGIDLLLEDLPSRGQT